MFAGIDVARAWPQAGMTTARWMAEVPVQSVPIRDLVATQPGIYLAPLLDPTPPVSGDELPHIIRWGGRWFLEDGHHRAVRAALAGRHMLTGRVLEVRG